MGPFKSCYPSSKLAQDSANRFGFSLLMVLPHNGYAASVELFKSRGFRLNDESGKNDLYLLDSFVCHVRLSQSDWFDK